MPSVKEIKIMESSSDEAKSIEGTDQIRDNAAPLKPMVYFMWSLINNYLIQWTLFQALHAF